MRFGPTTTVLLLFGGVVLPILEILVLLQVGRRIGVLPTLALVVIGVLAGGYLARHEGMRSWREIGAAASRGEAPTRELFAGVLVLVGAALLALPGFLSDVVGIALLVPPIRRGVVALAARRWAHLPSPRRGPDATVIPGEVVEEPASDPRDPGSPPPALEGRVLD